MLEGNSIRLVGAKKTQATAGRRKRAHLLLHDGPADLVQRLLIVLQPNSYVRPHHHSRQREMLILQQGRGALLILDDNTWLVDPNRTESNLLCRPNPHQYVALASSCRNAIP
jgi:cupin fold WbuC family metalloprotein